MNKPFEQAIRTLPQAVFKIGNIIAWICFTATLLLTVLIWSGTKNSIEENAIERLDYRANEIKYAFVDRMFAYKQMLRGGLGLLYASDKVERKEWKSYVSNLRINEIYPGILGVGFIEIINKNQKNGHIQKIRAEGFKDYKIWPEYEREFYTSVIYIEPFDKRNRRVFGFDMFSEPVRREAMEKARDNGRESLTGKITLVQETEESAQPGFLLFLPYYDLKGDTTTIEGRREALRGYVYCPFRMRDLMRGILGIRLDDIKLEVFDSSEPSAENLMYESSGLEDEQADIERTYHVRFKHINVDGRIWLFKFTSLPAFEASIDREKPLIILISGILISALFFILARNLSNIFIINRKMEQLLESTTEGIYGVDRKGKCTFMNNSACKMLGYEPEECLKKDMHNLIHYKKKDGEIYYKSDCPILISMKTKESCMVEDVFWKKDGTSFPVEYSSNPLIDNNNVSGAVIAFTNISERKKAMAQIESSLREKEVLLREIHHRVKNNLQIISSILNLQASYITDKRSLEIFVESKSRVRSMALIHEKLYQNKSLSRLNLKDYVGELIDNLIKSYSNSNAIQKEIEISEIFLNADTAIPLGLIINELVSNSLKYAFPNGRKGKISLKISRQAKGDFKMIASDNGIGLPKDFDINKAETLGLQLVNSLVKQLNGEIKINNEAGTQFEINFKTQNQA